MYYRLWLGSGIRPPRTIPLGPIYVDFRQNDVCGFINLCADTGWNVLDANVETTTTVLSKVSCKKNAFFLDVQHSSNKDSDILSAIEDYRIKKTNSQVYIVDSSKFIKLPNSVIGYYFDNDVLNYFKKNSFLEKGFEAKGGHKFHVQLFIRLFYEVSSSNTYQPVAGNGNFLLFYAPYRDMAQWKDDGIIIRAMNLIRNPDSQKTVGLYYGERGDIIDSQVLKPNMFTTQGYIGIPTRKGSKACVGLSFLNSIVAEYILNLFSGGHKMTTYVNQIPMPEYTPDNTKSIESNILKIIALKRSWFSLDETNLEYHGLISHFDNKESLKDNLEKIQEKLTVDYDRYEGLVTENDDLWMDLAEIAPDSDFRKTLNEYKSRRPYEELLSIDGASTNNVINNKVIAQEIVQELVGLVFGRWDIRYTKDKPVPDFGDVFDPLPFMPVVSLKDDDQNGYPLEIPQDGIIKESDMVDLIRKAMEYIWGEKADDIEYELCQLIGTESLTEYLEDPNGFFAYHFMRYTKSRRKAPIYWPLSSEDESETWWVYYPKLDERTLPNLVLKLTEEITKLRADLQRTDDKDKASRLNNEMLDLQAMSDELRRLQALPYKPNQDDGVPVTAAPLYTLFKNKKWRAVCEENWQQLEKGGYDWSHLAYAIYPARIRQKAKKDWCMALTHGLEELCENKPKEKKKKTTKNKKVNEASLF